MASLDTGWIAGLTDGCESFIMQMLGQFGPQPWNNKSITSQHHNRQKWRVSDPCREILCCLVCIRFCSALLLSPNWATHQHSPMQPTLCAKICTVLCLQKKQPALPLKMVAYCGLHLTSWHLKPIPAETNAEVQKPAWHLHSIYQHNGRNCRSQFCRAKQFGSSNTACHISDAISSSAVLCFRNVSSTDTTSRRQPGLKWNPGQASQ